MSSPKQRKKARRRAEKQMDQAWEAVWADDLVLACKLSRRAVDLGPVNARLWLDHARILLQQDPDPETREDAEAALRTAIALAPTYGEAFAELARLQAGHGKLVQAERLQRRAVELQPSAEATAQHDSYRALLEARGVTAERGDAAAATEDPPSLGPRTERYDWDAVEAELRARGLARLPALLDAGECAALRARWDDATAFEHEVGLPPDDPRGHVTYRFFAPPLPELVAELRRELYARAAAIANTWQQLLGRGDRYPLDLAAFLARCRDAGQYRSTPILLRYERGGHNAPHRDVAGKVVFPLQLAVTLGPEPDAGGALVLTDDRPGKRLHQRTLSTAPGDGVLFCTAVRLAQVGGVWGLQAVRHGVESVTAEERYALGVPFHEHG